MLKSLKHESKLKLVFAGAVLLTVLFVILYNPRDQQYFEDVGKEILVARKICENSIKWVETNPDSLKLSKNKLDHIKVDGQPVTLKLVKYPRIIFLHTGYKHKGAQNELYCTFSDPRDSSVKYFFDYETESWVNKTLTRR